MRLIVTADIHYGARKSGDASTRDMAAEIQRIGADALVLAGDNATIESGLLRDCLACFDQFPGQKFAVCGNHDLWTRNGDSRQFYETEFPRIAANSGFHCLEGQPAVLGHIALVGSVGWYDYSFRDPELRIDERYYERKLLPGYARWNDGEYVRMGISDAEFSALAVGRLERTIQNVHDRVDCVVAVTHMTAFDCMCIRRPSPAWSFCNAFMGSRALGEMLLRYPKVSYHFCGHTHTPSRHQIGHLQTINVGSTYEEKRFEVLDL